ncbi:MAG: hypothetical protein R3A78_04045 [Polyangiales bacterium]
MFMALACVPSWTMAGVFLATGARWETNGAKALVLVHAATPAIAALVTKLAILRERTPSALGLRLDVNRWLAVGWLLPAAVLGVTLGVAALLPSVSLALAPADFWAYFRERIPDAAREAFERDAAAPASLHPALRMFFQGLVGGIFPASLLAIGPELGFRGFLHAELAPRMRAPLTGLCWALWYAPLSLTGYTFPESPFVGTALFAAALMALAFVLDELRTRSASIVPTCLFMGTFASVGPLASILTRAAPAWWTGPYGVAGVLALVVTAGTFRFALRAGATRNT